jgi:hypothetical protein
MHQQAAKVLVHSLIAALRTRFRHKPHRWLSNGCPWNWSPVRFRIRIKFSHTDNQNCLLRAQAQQNDHAASTAAPQRATKQQPLAITAQPQQPQCSERIHDVLVRFGLHERADCSIPLWSTATHHHITKKASPEQSTNEAIAEAFGDLRR